MPQKRKRKRTKLRPGPILLLAVIVVFVTGMLYSPITSISKYEVVGARPIDRPQIEHVMAQLKNVPWLKVNGQKIESDVTRIQAVDSAEYSQIIFGRGRLTVKYRTPIAVIKSNRKIGMDAKGVLFVTDELPKGLPVVVRPDSANEVPLTVLGPFPSGAIADLAVKARGIDPSAQLTIWFNRDGALCLNIGEAPVIFGAADEIDKKLKALKEILEQEPDLLGNLRSLNLTEPTHPAKTYKKQRE
jgi:hypothetical protein